MSHDIRTPMNAIVGFTALAASHIDNREQVKDYLGKISVSSQHLLSLINDVLDMSRIESGKVTIEEADTHLPDIIHDLRTIIQSSVSAKQLELFVDTQDIVHEDIITDKLRLNQVLLNILSNAIKFTPSGGTISFRVIEKPSSAADLANFEFRIKDNGIGMSEEFQKTIFDAFTRERTSTVSGIQGTGLGMAITKNIVDMMGGTISVHSVQGKGSEFVVLLPCRISGHSTKVEAIPELHGLRALVADDDTNTCLSVCSMLREIGMRPDWTNYGKEAVVRAKEALEHADEFRVYIIDWMMPDLNGIETVRRIRRIIGDSTPIIILTAYDWADVEEEAAEAGVTAFCSKPLFMSELRNVLAQPFRTSEKVPEPAALPADFSGKRILLAEDNEMNQMIAVAILGEVGFDVEIAGDGAEAVKKIEEAPPEYYDIILMDIQMPQMNGYEAAKQIRSLGDPKKAGIPIVAVTANAFEEDRKVALEAGMNGHLAKPYDVAEIMRTLREILC
jgi:CheY-like chemotaxis protein/anti-sigma regulatory factor (Ser/Thr protein kinase)